MLGLAYYFVCNCTFGVMHQISLCYLDDPKLTPYLEITICILYLSRCIYLSLSFFNLCHM